MKAIVNINVTDMRSEPDFHSERISQALFNEDVEILETGDEYCRVRSGDGYKGWIAGRFLSEYQKPTSEGPFLVASALAPALERNEPESRRVTSIPYGCSLYGKITENCLEVGSERYGSFFVSLSNLSGPGLENQTLILDKENLIRETEKFLGAPYLWGGRSFFGIDCSGYSQAIMRRFGVVLPRDTKDQIKSGRDVKRNEIKTGDLLFFPRHVTIAISDTLMIHSSLSNGGVAYNSLDGESPLYSEYLARTFISARRVLY
jgi:hypothetical protein